MPRAIVVLLVALAMCGGALAHTGATGIVKQRMDVMSDIGKRMKSIGRMLAGQQALDADRVRAHARTIAEHAGMIPDLFPPGSTEAPSEALPAIWTQWTRFEKISSDMGEQAAALAEAAASAGGTADIAAQVKALGATCKSCHSDFRAAQ